METALFTEFYTTPTGELEIKSTSGVTTYTKADKAVTNFIFTELEEKYPKALKALNEIYLGSVRNLPYYKYLCVHRFMRCNCGKYDNITDIDGNGYFHFEFVDCPLRGRECKYENIICNPEFQTNLSLRELAVMELLCRGLSFQQTADALYIAESTVKKHKSNAFARKGIKTLAEFVIYAQKNNIFQK